MLPGTPKIGVFVFPDNSKQGLLESLLLTGAETVIPEIHGVAVRAVDEIDGALAQGHPCAKELRKASGREKACAGVIANVLKPGKSLAVAIQDKFNSWFTTESLKMGPVCAIDAFLGQLL